MPISASKGIFVHLFNRLVARAAGLEPSRPTKHQADNPLKMNDNFSSYRPSRLVIPHTLRATRWSSQEDYLKESRHTQCKALLDILGRKAILSAYGDREYRA